MTHSNYLEEKVLLAAINHGSSNGMVQLGDLYFHLSRKYKNRHDNSNNQADLEKMALKWYIRASDKGHALGSYYAGFIYHYVSHNLLR